MSGCSDKSLSSVHDRLANSRTRSIRTSYTSTERLNIKKTLCVEFEKPVNNLDCCKTPITKQASTNLSRDHTKRYYSSKSEYLKKQMDGYKQQPCYSSELNNKYYHKQGAASASEKIQRLNHENRDSKYCKTC